MLEIICECTIPRGKLDEVLVFEDYLFCCGNNFTSAWLSVYNVRGFGLLQDMELFSLPNPDEPISRIYLMSAVAGSVCLAAGSLYFYVHCKPKKRI